MSKNKAAMEMVKRHLKLMFDINGEVSDPVNCIMNHPDGTRTKMVAYKLIDVQQEPFWVAMEKLEL